uniref:RING-type domain-containing protein n=1 Tax=Clytia hemisphaerica TaxID=252671 RepID=A0A7M5WV84_9CNID
MTLVCDDKQLLQDAKQYINQLMCCEKPSGNDSDSVLCHFCRKTIAFDNARPPRKVNQAVGENKQESDEQSDMEKKQKDGKIVENEAIVVGDVGVRLLLCGCTFCVECLKWYINGTLENQEVQKIHEPIHCPKCNKVLMIKDLNILPNYLKEKICRKIFTNYLRARQKNGRNRERFDICRECKSIFIYDVADKGIFRCWNDKCRLMSCSVCKRRVMSNNEIDFEQHRSCWNDAVERCELKLLLKRGKTEYHGTFISNGLQHSTVNTFNGINFRRD